MISGIGSVSYYRLLVRRSNGVLVLLFDGKLHFNHSRDFPSIYLERLIRWQG